MQEVRCSHYVSFSNLRLLKRWMEGQCIGQGTKLGGGEVWPTAVVWFTWILPEGASRESWQGQAEQWHCPAARHWTLR